MQDIVYNFLEQHDLPKNIITDRNLSFFPDANELIIADVSQSGREHMLAPDAAKAWMRMRNRAFMDGVSLIIVSGFRSFERQAEIISECLEKGQTPEQIFATSAPPGCSEHHTGRAIDIGTMGCKPLSEDFAKTDAFKWLQDDALNFGFTLSYPENNKYGFAYEPWHWCYSIPAT